MCACVVGWVYSRPRLRYCCCCVRCTLGRVMVRHVKQLVNLSYNISNGGAAAGVRCKSSLDSIRLHYICTVELESGRNQFSRMERLAVVCSCTQVYMYD